MQFQELTYLLSPIILIITALFVLIIDFFTNRKSVLMIYTLFGIFISALILVIQFIMKYYRSYRSVLDNTNESMIRLKYYLI